MLLGKSYRKTSLSKCVKDEGEVQLALTIRFVPRRKVGNLQVKDMMSIFSEPLADVTVHTLGVEQIQLDA